MSGFWLALGIGLGGVLLVAAIEWWLLRMGQPPQDDGTANRED